MRIRAFYLVFLSFILTNASLYGGTGSVIHSISSLNNPIMMGQQVYFNSSVIRSQSCLSNDVILGINFGPFANPMNTSVFFSENSGLEQFQIVGPVVFNTVGTANVTQFVDFAPCSNNGEIGLPLDILPERIIPTMSEWGLILLGMICMIVGVVSLKKQTPSIV